MVEIIKASFSGEYELPISRHSTIYILNFGTGNTKYTHQAINASFKTRARGTSSLSRILTLEQSSHYPELK